MALQEFVKVYTAESNFTGIQGYNAYGSEHV